MVSCSISVQGNHTYSLRALESIKAGKRIPETQFSNLKVAAKGQQSVYGMFKKTSSTASSEASGA